MGEKGDMEANDKLGKRCNKFDTRQSYMGCYQKAKRVRSKTHDVPSWLSALFLRNYLAWSRREQILQTTPQLNCPILSAIHSSN